MPADFLTAEQRATLAAVRNQLLSVHNIDKTSLNDMEMTARMAVLVEIVKSRNMDSSQLPQVLAELSDKFMDMAAPGGEMMMVAEETRH